MLFCCRILTLLLTVLVVFSSCAKRLHIDESRRELISDWPMSRKSPANDGYMASNHFDGQLDILWEAGVSGKPAGPLSIAMGMVCYPSAKKKLRFFDTKTGRYLGRLKTKGQVPTGLSVADSLGVYAVGPRRNRLVCIDLVHRKKLWQYSLRDVVGGTIITENLVLAAGSDGQLLALRLETGQEVWVHRDSGRFAAGPTVAQGRLLQPVEDGRLLILSMSDGSLLHEVKMPGRLVSIVAMDSLAYMSTLDGQLCAVDILSGRVVWQATVGGDCWTSPAVADGRVFVTTSNGSLEAFDAASGDRLWQWSSDGVMTVPATVVGQVVVVATLTGQVVSLDAATGELMYERRLSRGVDQPVVTDGHRIFVATKAGRIICFGDANAALSQVDHRSSPDYQPKGTSPFICSRAGNGMPQGLNLRGRSSYGRAGGGKAVLSPR